MKTLVVMLSAAVLLTAQLALAQCGPNGCPDGNCPPQQQIFGGDSWAPRGTPMGIIRPETPRVQRQDTQAPVSKSTPPEWLCHVFGASGMLIYKDDQVGVVLTAYHVIQGSPRNGIIVRFPDGKAYTGRIFEVTTPDISADKLYDAACIEIRMPNAKPVSMAKVKPPEGTPVWVVGYGASQYRVRAARVAGYMRGTWRGPGPVAETMQLQGRRSAVGGDSGGALVNAAGELVGVISTSDRDTITRGPSLARIHALCADERFRWPWRDEIRQFGQDIGRLDDDKADRSELPPVPPVRGLPPAPPVPGVSEGDVRRIMDQDAYGLSGEIDANRSEIDANRGRIVELERLGEIGKSIATEFAGVSRESLVSEAGKKAHDSVNDAIDKAAAAAAALERAMAGLPAAAKKAAEDAVPGAVAEVIEDDSFLEGLSERFGIDGLVSDRLEAVGFAKTAGGVRWLWGLVIGTSLGYFVLVVIAGAIVWDIWAKLKHGHPLFIQTVTEIAKQATPYIPTRIDDRIAGTVDKGVDVVADAAAERVRGWLGIKVEQAVAKGVEKGVAAATKKGK